jgi:phosphatidylglycerophosphate synthase
MYTYTEFVRRCVNAFKRAVTRLLVRRNVSADAITFTGFVCSWLAAAAFATGCFPWGGVMILLAGACDVFDGAVAKESGRITAFGGVFDSCLDR